MFLMRFECSPFLSTASLLRQTKPLRNSHILDRHCHLGHHRLTSGICPITIVSLYHLFKKLIMDPMQLVCASMSLKHVSNLLL